MSSQYNFHNLVNNDKNFSKTSKLYKPRINLLHTNNYLHTKNNESKLKLPKR